MNDSSRGDITRNVWWAAAAVFVVSLLVYWISAVYLDRARTPTTAYFNLLADAFLNGRLHLVNPPSVTDLTLHNGLWYVAFPPLPAVLMLPLVAVLGPYGVNTVLFSAALGAMNVALVFSILQLLASRNWTRLSVGDNLWLAALFGVGSVHWYISTMGTVWLVSQNCTVTFVSLAVWLAASGRSPWLVGGALALAALARPHIALTYPLLLAFSVKRHDWKPNRSAWHAAKGWLLKSLAPLTAALALLLLYNHARFGSFADFGYLKQNVSRDLAYDLLRYGQFDLRYVSRNLWTMLVSYPVWDGATGTFVPSGKGMSIFITTPAIVYSIRARGRDPLVLGGWLSVCLVLIPLLTYYNTGWIQFGYRFSLDFMVPLVVLLAVGAADRVSWTMRGLIILGILVNAWGTSLFPNPV